MKICNRKMANKATQWVLRLIVMIKGRVGVQLVDTLYTTSLKCNSMGCQAGEHSSREEHLLCAHVKSRQP